MSAVDSTDVPVEKGARPGLWARTSKKTKILIAAVAALVVIGLAVGLGVGLTVGRNKDDGDNDNSNNGPNPNDPVATSGPSEVWRPTPNTTWQIVLQSAIELDADATSVTPDVEVYDIDLFTNSPEVMGTLKRLGKKVICYFSGGSYEPYRPDSDQFQESDFGKVLDGWEDEKWLDLNSPNVRRIMEGRIKLAAEKGCDAIDPDNVDGFDNENGIDLTATDSINFLEYLSSVSLPLNLSMGLKNAASIIPNVLNITHFSVNEQCVENEECGDFSGFINDTKPVFHIEYPEGAGRDISTQAVTKNCEDTGAAEGSFNFSTVLKPMNLSGWVQYCNGQIDVTPQNTTAWSSSEDPPSDD